MIDSNEKNFFGAILAYFSHLMAVKLNGAMYWNRRQRVIPAIMIITKKRDLSSLLLSAVQILIGFPSVFSV